MKKNASYLSWSNFWIGFLSVLTLGLYPSVFANIRHIRSSFSASQKDVEHISDVQHLVNDMRASIEAYQHR